MADEKGTPPTVTPPATETPTAGAGAGKAGDAGAGAAGAGAAAAEGGDDTSIVGGKAAAATPEPGKPAGDGKPPTPPQGAPEKYEPFKLAEGMVIEPTLLESAQKTFKELNLTQEAAQKLVDIQSQLVAKQQEEQAKAYNEMRSKWQSDSKAVLGAEPDKTLALVAKARDSFGTPELQKFLNESGLGDHPEVVRFFAAVGRAIAEDDIPDGGRGGAAPKTQAEALYPTNKT